MRPDPRPVAQLVGLLAVLGTATAATAEVRVELNKLEPHGGDCRAYLLLENASGAGFENLALDLVMFDGEGVVARRMAVETAPLPAGKTSLKAFDVDGLACAGIGRVLLNDVLECVDDAGPRGDCLALVSTAARGSVPFVE